MRCKLAAVSHAAEPTSSQTALHWQSLKRACLLVVPNNLQTGPAKSFVVVYEYA